MHPSHKGENNKLYLKIREKEVTCQADGNSKLALHTFSLCPTFLCASGPLPDLEPASNAKQFGPLLRRGWGLKIAGKHLPITWEVLRAPQREHEVATPLIFLTLIHGTLKPQPCRPGWSLSTLIRFDSIFNS